MGSSGGKTIITNNSSSKLQWFYNSTVIELPSATTKEFTNDCSIKTPNGLEVKKCDLITDGKAIIGHLIFELNEEKDYTAIFISDSTV